MTTNQDQSRADFETVMQKEFPFTSLSKVEGTDQYAEFSAKVGHAMWQAARRAPSVAPAVPEGALRAALVDLIAAERIVLTAVKDFALQTDFRTRFARAREIVWGDGVIDAEAGSAQAGNTLLNGDPHAEGRHTFSTTLPRQHTFGPQMVAAHTDSDLELIRLLDGYAKDATLGYEYYFNKIKEHFSKAAADDAGELPPLPEIGSLIPPEMQRDIHKMMREYALKAIRANTTQASKEKP